MKNAILLLLMVTFAQLSQAQTLAKVVIEKHENGKPSLVNYYEGAKIPENLRKQETFNIDGNIILEKNYKETLLDGLVREYKEFDGSLVLEMNYKAGKKDGKQTIYFSDGRVKMELDYLEGALNGMQKEYFFKEDTLHKAETNYSGGVLHGIQTRFNADGSQAYQYRFVAGKPEGVQKTWKAGAVEEEMWQQGKLEVQKSKWSEIQAKESEFYTFVNEGDSLNIKFGKKLDKSIRFFDNGSIQAILTPGEDGGMLKEYHPNGKVKGQGKGTFDSKEGKWEYFHQNGEKMMAGEYKDGKKLGVFSHWDEKGRLIEEEVWNAAGDHRESWTVMGYHWNDKKAYEGSVTHEGWKTGIWKYWYELGEKKIEEEWIKTCKNNDERFVLEDYNEWTKSGKLVRTGNEREQFEFAYHPNGEVKTKTTVLFVDRDPCVVDQPERYVEGRFEKKMTDPGYHKTVNTLIYTFKTDGDSALIERFASNGSLSGDQVGWYPKSNVKRYSIHFFEGRVQGTVKEWYPDGSIKLNHKYQSDVAGPYRLVEGSYFSEKGKEYKFVAADGKDKKKQMIEIESNCYFFDYMKEHPNE